MRNFYATLVLFSLWGSVVGQTPVVIGTTTYDYQTYGSTGNHLIGYNDGRVSAAWMGSNTFATGFSNLGTYYNHFNGTSWGTFPTGRLETQKTYSTGMVRVHDGAGDHEVVLADDVAKIRVYKNTDIGSTSWSQTGGSNVLDVWYPMAYCPAGTNDIYVVGQKPNTEDLLFSRSDDGGETWAVSEYALPYTTEAYGCDIVLSGSYNIVAQGSDVYILYGSLVSDLILMHSASNGDIGTWVIEATLIDFPIDNYTAGAGETTDWDGDGDYDWLDTNDGIHEMIITDDGTVHVFSGRMQIRDIAGVTGFYYDYTKGGIWHWKTGDASATLLEDFMIDWDGDGNPTSGITSNNYAYNYESFTFMPAAAYDESINRIYLTYMMPVEDEISASNQNYYDIFGSYSDDEGATWSEPINLTYKAYKGLENAYQCTHKKTINNKIEMMWQQDDEPGTYIDPSPYDDEIHTNNMMFVAWDSTRFQPYDPTVNFSYVSTFIGPDYSVVFTNLTTDAETYFWDFDDGGTSTAENPTHTFAPGIYNVCLTGYNHYGDATSCQTITLMNAPVADFSYTGDPTVSFFDESTGGTPTDWYWTFGDGGTSTMENPVHTYAANGIYNVCLTASNGLGESTFCQNVVIDAYPVADFSFTDADPFFSFFDASTGDPTGFTWSWNFGDGGTSTLENPTHTYLGNDTYTVCLTVTNIYGTDSYCADVIVDSYLAPVVDFSYSGDPIVNFIDLSTGFPWAWDWDFGDGGSSSLENPTHEYLANGNYNVCLTATNDLGSATHCEMITIDGYAAPVALFTYSGDPDVTFTDLTSNDPTAWIWDFGDGGFSTIQNPVHTFTENGTYLVCLTAIAPGGSDEFCDNIDIELAEVAPVADFSWESIGTLTIDFTDLSANDPTEWNWDFGDGSISPLQNPIHTYATGGEYTVCLTATNAIGSNEYCDLVMATSVEPFSLIPLNLYPNPSEDYIHLQTGITNSEFNLKLTNSIGQVLEPQLVTITNNEIVIDVHLLPAGNYFLILAIGDRYYCGTFIRD